MLICPVVKFSNLRFNLSEKVNCHFLNRLDVLFGKVHPVGLQSLDFPLVQLSALLVQLSGLPGPLHLRLTAAHQILQHLLGRFSGQALLELRQVGVEGRGQGVLLAHRPGGLRHPAEQQPHHRELLVKGRRPQL